MLLHQAGSVEVHRQLLYDGVYDLCEPSMHVRFVSVKEGKVLPYSLPSVGPRADPGVQAVS